MEIFQHYRGWGIRYRQITGTTYVEHFGFHVKKFIGKGEIDGNKLAKEFIDGMERD